MVEHHAAAAASSGEAIPRPRIERHAVADLASSGEPRFANLKLPPKVWWPPTLEEAQALVRYTGEQPQDCSKRLCLEKDLLMWRDVCALITEIAAHGEADDDDRRAADALLVVEQLWLRSGAIAPVKL